MDELNTWTEGPSANRSIDSNDQLVKTNFLIFLLRARFLPLSILKVSKD